MSNTELRENCRVEVRSSAGELVFTSDDCDVRFDGDQLVVSYWDDDGAVVFAGRANEGGRFELWCRTRPIRAELAKSADGARLSGTWSRDDESGPWSIDLAADN